MNIYPSGTLIANRYEVVQGPREKPSLAGGMGLVYLCVDHAENGRPVALKTFRPELLPDRAARDRFLREGTTWVQLGKHPHIVRCHRVTQPDVGLQVYFVLELIAAAEAKRNASLRSWLVPGKPLSVEQALLFALHIARGMKHATTKILGLVHRDLKPENVLVGRDGIARVTDFGLASAMQVVEGNLQMAIDKESDKTSFGRTQLTRGIVGTPLYMAPEQWAGTELDARTDIYAFGCILYEMIAGTFVVSGKNVRELEEAHLTGQISKTPLDLPNDLTRLQQQCMVVNREARFDNWTEVEKEVVKAYKIVTGKNVPNPIDVSEESRTERVANGWSYNEIGCSYHDIGKFEVARAYFEQVLTTARVEAELLLEAAGLGNLSITYLHLGDPQQAIELQEKSLAISFKIGDRRGQGQALGNLGNAYLHLGDARQGIEFHQKRLTIAREIGDRNGEIAALGNLCNAYRQLGDSRRAIDFCQKHLDIVREIGDRRSEGQTLGNLGNAYILLGDPRKAIEFYEKSLVIAQEIGDRQKEGMALGSLGTAYRQLGNPRQAIEFYEKSLTIAHEIGDRQGEGSSLGNLGNAYCQLGNVYRAIEFYEKHLVIARDISDRQAEGMALGNLGNAFRQIGDHRRAIEFCEKHLVLAHEIDDVMGAAATSANLALLLLQQRRLTDALSHAEYAEQIFKQIGNAAYAAKAQQLINQIRIHME